MRNRCISMEFAVALSWQGTCAFCHLLVLVGLMALSSVTGYPDRAEAQGSGVARVEGSESGIPGETSASVEESGVEIFTGVAEQTGMDFVHFNGMSGNYYYPEMIGPGGALFDYDLRRPAQLNAESRNQSIERPSCVFSWPVYQSPQTVAHTRRTRGTCQASSN